MPHDLLEELVGESGLHPAIGRPMLDIIKAPKRVKVLEVVGESRLPTSGMVPGCPLATRVMEYLLARWRQRERGPINRPVPRVLRTWVNDSTGGELGNLPQQSTLIADVRL